MNKKMDIYKVILISIILLYPLPAQGQSTDKSSCSAVLDSLICTLNILIHQEDVHNPDITKQAIAYINSVRNVVPPDTTEFDLLLTKTSIISSLLENYQSTLLIKDTDGYSLIVLTEGYFDILCTIEHSLNHTFNHLHWQDRLRNMLPVTQSQLACHYAKINLFILLAYKIGEIEAKKERRRGWKVLQNMFQCIAPEMFDTKKNLDIAYLYAKRKELIEVIERLDFLCQKEREEDVRAYASRVLQSIHERFAQIVGGDRISTPPQLAGKKEDPVDWFKQAEQAQEEYVKIELYTKVIHTNPQHVAAFINRGNSYLNLQRYALAIEDYQNAIAVEPDNIIAYYNLGNAYLYMKQYEEAIRTYDKVIELDSQHYASYVNRGNALRKIGKHHEAIRNYTSAITLNPNDPLAYLNRGISYRLLAEYQKAIKDYTKVIELNANNTTAYFNLGCLYWIMKNWHATIQIWEECLKIDPTYEQVLDWLPKAYSEAKLAKYRGN